MAFENEVEQVTHSIIVYGPSGAGKTSLIQLLLYGHFRDDLSPTIQLQSFNHMFSVGSNNLGKPYYTEFISCTELPESYLHSLSNSTFGHHILPNAQTILMVIDYKNLPAIAQLKQYVTLNIASENTAIHVIVSKFDLAIQNRAEEQEAIIKYLEEAHINAHAYHIHFISVKDNHNIQTLRNSLCIPEPHSTSALSLPNQLPARPMQIIGGFIAAITIGILSEKILSLLAGDLIGTVAATCCTIVTLSMTPTGSWLIKKIKRNHPIHSEPNSIESTFNQSENMNTDNHFIKKDQFTSSQTDYLFNSPLQNNHQIPTVTNLTPKNKDDTSPTSSTTSSQNLDSIKHK